MESNQLGKSIVKVACIVSVAIIICTAIYTFNKDRYAPLGVNGAFIDQVTGNTYSVHGKKIE